MSELKRFIVFVPCAQESNFVTSLCNMNLDFDAGKVDNKTKEVQYQFKGRIVDLNKLQISFQIKVRSMRSEGSVLHGDNQSNSSSVTNRSHVKCQDKTFAKEQSCNTKPTKNSGLIASVGESNLNSFINPDLKRIAKNANNHMNYKSSNSASSSGNSNKYHNYRMSSGSSKACTNDDIDEVTASNNYETLTNDMSSSDSMTPVVVQNVNKGFKLDNTPINAFVPGGFLERNLIGSGDPSKYMSTNDCSTLSTGKNKGTITLRATKSLQAEADRVRYTLKDAEPWLVNELASFVTSFVRPYCQLEFLIKQIPLSAEVYVKDYIIQVAQACALYINANGDLSNLRNSNLVRFYNVVGFAINKFLCNNKLQYVRDDYMSVDVFTSKFITSFTTPLKLRLQSLYERTPSIELPPVNNVVKSVTSGKAVKQKNEGSFELMKGVHKFANANDSMTSDANKRNEQYPMAMIQHNQYANNHGPIYPGQMPPQIYPNAYYGQPQPLGQPQHFSNPNTQLPHGYQIPYFYPWMNQMYSNEVYNRPMVSVNSSASSTLGTANDTQPLNVVNPSTKPTFERSGVTKGYNVDNQLNKRQDNTCPNIMKDSTESWADKCEKRSDYMASEIERLNAMCIAEGDVITVENSNNELAEDSLVIEPKEV